MKKFNDAVSTVCRIKLPFDKSLKNAFLAYESSWETVDLKSEQTRKIYCELIDLQKFQKPVEKIQKDVIKLVVFDAQENECEIEEDDKKIEQPTEKRSWWNEIPHIDTKHPKSLSELAIERYAKNYKRGPIDDRVQCLNATDFGLFADIELPIMDLLDLENESFWKRLVETKVQNMSKFYEYLRSPKTNWKQIGIELKLSEFIENLAVEEFNHPNMVLFLEKLMISLQPFIENLVLRKMKSRKNHNYNKYNPKYKILNVPSIQCYHGSLGFIRYLTNLKVVSLMFGTGCLGINYERWLFKSSAIDFENLSIGIEKLEFLESFTISSTDLSESIKLFHILKSLQEKQHLKHLELSSCAISDDVGDHFKGFFEVNKSLESLELKYNSLNTEACNGIGKGIMSFQGVLKYLGLAGNQVFEAGFLAIGAGCKNSSQIQILDVKGCNLGENGGFRVAQLIGFHKALTSINACNVRFNAKGVKKLMENIETNYNLDSLECNDCNLTDNHMLKIKLVLKRNKYYKDNPLMRRAEFTSDDELEIDKWLKRVKHPLLLKHQRNYNSSDNTF
ncbi:unnamed protein product [Diamesa serratosioi]